MYAFDFGNTTISRFSLSVWYNNTNDLNTTQGPPLAQRINQVTPWRCSGTSRGSCQAWPVLPPVGGCHRLLVEGGLLPAGHQHGHKRLHAVVAGVVILR